MKRSFDEVAAIEYFLEGYTCPRLTELKAARTAADYDLILHALYDVLYDGGGDCCEIAGFEDMTNGEAMKALGLFDDVTTEFADWLKNGEITVRAKGCYHSGNCPCGGREIPVSRYFGEHDEERAY